MMFWKEQKLDVDSKQISGCRRQWGWTGRAQRGLLGRENTAPATMDAYYVSLYGHGCIWLFVAPMDRSLLRSVSMGFSQQNTRVGCYAPLQGDVLTKGLNLCLLAAPCITQALHPHVESLKSTLRYTFSQTQRKYNIKSDPECKLWTLGDYDISVHLSL